MKNALLMFLFLLTPFAKADVMHCEDILQDETPGFGKTYSLDLFFEDQPGTFKMAIFEFKPGKHPIPTFMQGNLLASGFSTPEYPLYSLYTEQGALGYFSKDQDGTFSLSLKGENKVPLTCSTTREDRI